MTLRRKLLTAFAALAVMSLLSAGLTIWSTANQNRLLDEIEEQYAQSLVLQRIRAATTTLFRKQALALVLANPQSTEHFEELDTRVRHDFDELRERMTKGRDPEKHRVLKEAYDALTAGLFAAIRPRELAEADIEPPRLPPRGDFVAFRELVDRSLDENERSRDRLKRRIAQLRETIQLAVAISAFGTLCLVLLLAAYVASDIFAPLAELEGALDDAARGSYERRLNPERDDELGRLHHAFNRAIENIARRGGVIASPSDERDDDERSARTEIHRIASDVRSAAYAVGDATEEGDPAHEAARDVITRVDTLCATVDRIAAFHLPIELSLDRVDLRALLYEYLAEVHRELGARAVHVRLDVPGDLPVIAADRARLREVLDVLVRGALAQVPEGGGTLTIRAERPSDATDRLVLEIEDDGRHTVIGAFEETRPSRTSTAPVEFRLARRVVEQHGGQLAMHAGEHGRRVTIELPTGAPPA